MNYEAGKNRNSNSQSQQSDKAETEASSEKREDDGIKNNEQKIRISDSKKILIVIGIYLIGLIITAAVVILIYKMWEAVS